MRWIEILCTLIGHRWDGWDAFDNDRICARCRVHQRWTTFQITDGNGEIVGESRRWVTVGHFEKLRF